MATEGVSSSSSVDVVDADLSGSSSSSSSFVSSLSGRATKPLPVRAASTPVTGSRDVSPPLLTADTLTRRITQVGHLCVAVEKVLRERQELNEYVPDTDGMPRQTVPLSFSLYVFVCIVCVCV